MEQNEEYNKALEKLKRKRRIISVKNVDKDLRAREHIKAVKCIIAQGRVAYDFNSGIINPVKFKNFGRKDEN